MQTSVVILLAKQFFRKVFFTKGLSALLILFLLALAYVVISGWGAFEKRHESIVHHQEESRNSWETNPDKHPHRMAHFGSFAFRMQHPLCIFDSGIESYTGNSIYLEAHKQNTANFSEASLSTGMARFGNLDVALLLQLILPLIIFFIGYSSITSEKENSTLKIIYLQGVSMREILLGKALGLFLVSGLFFVPALITLWSISLIGNDVLHGEIVLRSFLITISYVLFFIVLCLITVIISAKSEHSNKALLSLLGGWLLFFIIIPKTAQVVGNSIYPNLSSVEFKDAIEKEVSRQGDSHNPEDPHFNNIRDSVLKANKVSSVKDLPFNYSGFLMSKGEKLTAKIYNKEHERLINTYKKQNSITNDLILFNPYLAIKSLSMGLSATDFHTYTDFLSQTELYRYKQSQYVNELQIKFISNKAKGSEGKVHVVDSSYWKSAPKFRYEYLSISETMYHQLLALVSLSVWLVLSIVIIIGFSNQFKVI